jgi:rod shape-determining protein MreD
MDWTKQIGRYILVMILQVLLFDQLQLLGVCHPYIYVLCLLMMPITLSHSADMIIGAVVGLIMDIFCNSMGVHTAACIFIMFIRPYLIGAIVNDKDRLNEQISLRSLGMEALLRYVVILVVIHHLIVFLLAAWNWAHIGFVLVETLVSSLVTISVIIGYNSLRYR